MTKNKKLTKSEIDELNITSESVKELFKSKPDFGKIILDENGTPVHHFKPVLRNVQVLAEITIGKPNIMGKAVKKPITIEFRIAAEEELIETLEGTMKANIGDYIITGINGEIYPCKPDIFLNSYTIINEDQ